MRPTRGRAKGSALPGAGMLGGDLQRADRDVQLTTYSLSGERRRTWRSSGKPDFSGTYGGPHPRLLPGVPGGSPRLPRHSGGEATLWSRSPTHFLSNESHGEASSA